MVLEYLFPEDWLEKKVRYAFILAVVYSTVSLIVARLLFGSNSGIVSVFFTTILLMPYLKKLLWKEEQEEIEERKVTLQHLWHDNHESIKVYAALFFGIYLAYTAYTFLLPQLGLPVEVFFKEQLTMGGFLRGAATFHTSMFFDIFLNNWWVLLACFLLALISGDGALFFITWNASTWGTIFGYRALVAAAGGAWGPWTNLAIILVITFPHVILEGGAYILAAISGGVLSDDVVSKRSAMEKFIIWFIAAIVLYVIAFFLLRLVFAAWPVVATITELLVAIGLLHALSYVFDDPKHTEVFQYNYYLFLIAILIFLLGALVETLVVGNSSLLLTVYAAIG